ncbi:MAG: glutaredoxin family protein [Firmicutes bacterium]|nr:glutaredoxin family protein [Bacillota bacterium]
MHALLGCAKLFKGDPMRVVLVRRKGCSLCEETHRRLETLGVLAADRPFLYEEWWADEDPFLQQTYGERLPVLLIDGKEVASGRIEMAQLRALLPTSF